MTYNTLRYEVADSRVDASGADGASARLVDPAPRPQPAAQRLSEAMGAAYLALPQADSLVISAAVRGMADLRA